MRVQATAPGRVPRSRVPPASGTLAVLGVLGMLLAGCGGSGSAPAAVPSLSQGTSGTHAAGSGRAGLNPGNEPPAPPQLVQAGVRAAECQRAHGLPDVHDPTANTPYTPGHG